jgi:hypothetical protein
MKQCMALGSLQRSRSIQLQVRGRSDREVSAGSWLECDSTFFYLPVAFRSWLVGQQQDDSARREVVATWCAKRRTLLLAGALRMLFLLFFRRNVGEGGGGFR